MNEGADTTTVSILYGKSEMHVRLPRDARPTVIGKRPMQKLPDPRAAVRDALAQPIGAPPYETLVRGKRSACILICDITRPVPNHLFLRPLIEGLLGGGMAQQQPSGRGKAASDPFGDILGGLLGSGGGGMAIPAPEPEPRARQQPQPQGGGIGDILGSPLGKAVLGGIAAFAMKEMMDQSRKR